MSSDVSVYPYRLIVTEGTLTDNHDGTATLDTGGGSTISSDAPSSATDTCTAGDAAYDSSYFYMCVGTDTWKRVALATWGASACNGVLTNLGNSLVSNLGNSIITSSCGGTCGVVTSSGNTILTSLGNTLIGSSCSSSSDTVVTNLGNTLITGSGNTVVSN